MDCADVRGLLVAWQDGELSSDQSRIVEGHLEQCAACQDTEWRLARATPIPCLRTTPALERRLWKHLDRVLRHRQHGAAIGAAMNGQRPVVGLHRVEFSLLAIEQIVNNAAKAHYISNGQHRVPVVIRMEGTNVEEGKKIIAESGFNFQVADGMKDAAEKVVKAAQ